MHPDAAAHLHILTGSDPNVSGARKDSRVYTSLHSEKVKEAGDRESIILSMYDKE